MTSDEFIKQQVQAGYSVHVNKGVWWQKVGPFCYKPVLRLSEVKRGVANPSMFKSFLKYSFLVKNRADANHSWAIMVMSTEKLRNFSINSLSSSKRARVRKGLRLTEINKITDIEPFIDDIKEVCISTARRTKHGNPPEYYNDKYDEWSKWLRTEFSMPNREWWGAFHDGKLIAYMYSVQIDDKMYNYTAKSHTDYLDKCPNDALIFSFLEYCSKLENCNLMTFGDWGAHLQSLNRFKEKFGFEKVEYPMYVWLNPLVKMASIFTRLFSTKK